MASIPEQFTELNKGQVETALNLAQITMQSAERMMRLQLDATKAFISEQNETASALANTKDPNAMMALRTRIAEQTVERALGYSRNLYEVATQAQQELSRVFAQRFSSYQQEMMGAMEKMLKSSPMGGSEAALNAMKSTMAATQSAMDSITNAAKQTADMADANVRAMSDAAKGSRDTNR
jgi:phasin family protein